MLEDKNTTRRGLRGKRIENAPIGAQSWFRCGGHADMLFRPADQEDLQVFLNAHFASFSDDDLIGWDKQLTIIGGLANTIVRDGGVRDLTVQLGKPFAEVEVVDECTIRAGCGALNGNISAAAVKAGIGGLEFLSGIPGTLGGAVRMNAGAYGAEMKDVLVEVIGVNRKGEERRLSVQDLKMGYRSTQLSEQIIFTGALLKGEMENYKTVKERITQIKKQRNATQPIKERTGGSTFANPSEEELREAGLPEDLRAWQIVDRVGGRGLCIGGAKMSEKHCNFMVNTGTATATDLEKLGEEIRRRALADLGLALHWEIKRIGEKP